MATRLLLVSAAFFVCASGVNVTHTALNLTDYLPSTDEAFSSPVNATTVLFAGGGGWDGAFFVDTVTGAISVRNVSLSVGRGRGVAVACPDGSLIVLAGGQLSNGKQSASVDLYDTRTGAFTRGPDLSEGRSFLGGAAWGSFIYFAGGEADNDKDSVAVDVFNCSARAFVAAGKSPKLSVGRKKLAGASANGIVAFAGGFSSAKHAYEGTVDIFNATSGAWSKAALGQRRQYITAAAAGPYLAWGGGFCSPCGPGQPNASSSRSSFVDLLDTRTGEWSHAQLSQERSNLAAASVGGRYAIFAGGTSDVAAAAGYEITRSSVVDIFDGVAGSWSTAAMQNGACCNAAAGNANAAAVFGGGSSVVDLFAFSAPTAAPAVATNWVFEVPNAFGDTYTHMSMIAAVNDTLLAAACQAAKVHEADDDQHILFSTSRDGGATFAPPAVLAAGKTAVWGPVLHYDGSTLWAFYSTSSKSRCVGGSIVARKSADAGATFSAPTVLLAEDAFQKITANPLVVTASGRWLLPYWDTLECEGAGGRAYKNVSARVLMSDDRGATWAASGAARSAAGLGLIEGTLLAKSDGTVLQLFRTGETVLYASVSSDDGATWSDAAPTDVPNPNAKVCLLSNATRPLLAYNDDTSGRSPLSVAAASPDAAKWTKLVDVEPRADKESFAYPTIRRKTTGEVLVSYSYNYRGIKAAHITGLGV